MSERIKWDGTEECFRFLCEQFARPRSSVGMMKDGRLSIATRTGTIYAQIGDIVAQDVTGWLYREVPPND